MAETFAGFPAANIAEYFGVSPVAAQGLISLGNGKPVSSLPADQRAALAKIDPNQFKPGATGPNQGFGSIVWGLNHLAEHPMGSHYHGDFNVTDLVANVATGGLYGVAKAGFNTLTGQQNIVSGVKEGFAVTGTGGAVLQPTIGTNKTLVIEAAVAASALAPTLALALGPAAAFLKDTATKAFSTFIAGDNTVTPGAPGSPLLPAGSSTYVSVSGAGSAPAGGGGYFDTQGNYVPPAGAPAGLDSGKLLAIAGVGVLLFLILKRRK